MEFFEKKSLNIVTQHIATVESDLYQHSVDHGKY